MMGIEVPETCRAYCISAIKHAVASSCFFFFSTHVLPYPRKVKEWSNLKTVNFKKCHFTNYSVIERLNCYCVL